MHSINAMKKPLSLAIFFILSPVVFADDVAHQHMHMTDMSNEHTQHNMSMKMPDQIPSPIPSEKIVYAHDHQKQHGGQIYSSVTLDQSWRSTADGDAEFKSENELKIGNDEQKVILRVDVEKAESQAAEYDTKLLYSRMITEFWDLQAGVGYQDNLVDVEDRETRQDHVTAVIGLQGLAPYLFETESYLSVAKNDYLAFSFDLERDLLLTQKWIVQPYLELDAVLHDNSRYAEKTGFREVTLGLQNRYEISKQFMPYIDIAYRYEQDSTWRDGQLHGKSDQDWLYGVGVKLMF